MHDHFIFLLFISLVGKHSKSNLVQIGAAPRFRGRVNNLKNNKLLLSFCWWQ
jgi:hypothetical protein